MRIVAAFFKYGSFSSEDVAESASLTFLVVKPGNSSSLLPMTMQYAHANVALAGGLREALRLSRATVMV